MIIYGNLHISSIDIVEQSGCTVINIKIFMVESVGVIKVTMGDNARKSSYGNPYK